ncbi:hypothetical protein C7974DRAFT_444530 [Boeremia exigua]|uniref:uncharacterized protein n=1 Tax=Boeremia exigua TaxID=749465 RepID=UPI001E8E7C2A|nr:uncharacterized protein C7974DRAFT_444530 [Boeremia exigua]KAH6613043.1 hypothetical protein C7974DRAFT_444530 [Boeremia exigua]
MGSNKARRLDIGFSVAECFAQTGEQNEAQAQALSSTIRPFGLAPVNPPAYFGWESNFVATFEMIKTYYLVESSRYITPAEAIEPFVSATNATVHVLITAKNSGQYWRKPKERSSNAALTILLGVGLRKDVKDASTPPPHPAYLSWCEEKVAISDGAGLAGDVRLLGILHSRKYLEKIRCPMLILCPTGSAMMTVGLMEEVAAKVPNARLEMIRSAGHEIYAEAAELRIQKAIAFLASLESRGKV